MPRAAKDLVNLKRLEEAMDRQGLDAIVARAGLDFTYSCGLRLPRHLRPSRRPGRQPARRHRRQATPWRARIVLNTIARDLAERDSWIRKFHSVGAWWHQQEPVISRGNSRVLEDGMVIAMEPHIGHRHIQDMWVVRPNGPELISAKMATDRVFDCV